MTTKPPPSEPVGQRTPTDCMGTREEARQKLITHAEAWRALRQPLIAPAAEHRKRDLAERQAGFELCNTALLWLWHEENSSAPKPPAAAPDVEIEALNETLPVDLKIPPIRPVKGGEFSDGYVLVTDCDAEGGDVAMTYEQAMAIAIVCNSAFAQLRARGVAITGDLDAMSFAAQLAAYEERDAAVNALSAMAQRVQEAERQQGQEALQYAQSLATALWEKHWKEAAPNWRALDDLTGVLTQIDNAVAGLVRPGLTAQHVAHLEAELDRVKGELADAYEHCAKLVEQRGWWDAASAMRAFDIARYAARAADTDKGGPDANDH